jgi:hypothetical protein
MEHSVELAYQAMHELHVMTKAHVTSGTYNVIVRSSDDPKDTLRSIRNSKTVAFARSCVGRVQVCLQNKPASSMFADGSDSDGGDSRAFWKCVLAREEGNTTAADINKENHTDDIRRFSAAVLRYLNSFPEEFDAQQHALMK